jgi:protein-S-isoprenylcysteine O-methyltransferase Ste14
MVYPENIMNTLLRKTKYFIIGALLLTGMPLFFWGLDDIPGYFANSQRTAYAGMMVILTLLVTIFVPNEGRGVGEGEKLAVRQKAAILFLQISSMLTEIIPPICDRNNFLVTPDNPIIRNLGLLFTCVGYLFMNWSIMVLGKQFSINVTIQKDHELITKGPYRVIRHPRYLGIILFLLGISMVFRSWLSIILVLLTVMVLIWRISDEEKLMHDEFAGRWDEYRRKTWRLVPFLY